jgi:HEAT repeat protein
MLKDSEWSVRAAAVSALAATGDEAAYLPQIVEMLKDPEGFVREEAMTALGLTDEAAKAYLPQIVEFLTIQLSFPNRPSVYRTPSRSPS